MLGHILKTSTQGGANYPRLSEEPTFQALVRSSLPNGNVFVWANPRSITPILRASAQLRAEKLAVNVDWKQERQRLEDKTLREKFPNLKRPLSPDDQARLDEVVDPLLDQMERDIKATQVPALMAKEERSLTYAEAISAAMMVLALNPKSFELSLRVLAPLPE
jgi:hypothetical protein